VDANLSLDAFYVDAPAPPTHTQTQIQGQVQGRPPPNFVLDAGPAPAVRVRPTSLSLHDFNNPYLEQHALKHSASHPSKVADYGQPANAMGTKNYYVATMDKNASERRRPRTRSEPLYPPIPRHIHSAEPDSIWRTASTNPSQSPTDATQKSNKSQSNTVGLKVNDPLPTLTSPKNGKSKDDDSLSIITPPATDAMWQQFGFSRQDIISPVDQRMRRRRKAESAGASTGTQPLIRARNSKKDVFAKEAEAATLRKELEEAQTRIEALMKEKKKESAVEKDDDAKEADGKKETESLEQQQLMRYRHFVTCPSCVNGAQKSARNRVVIPCGHLVCTECSVKGEKGQCTCPLCDAKVERFQVLRIE